MESAGPVSKAQAASARLAIAVIFLMHGIMTGGWAPHIPLAKARLEVGTGVHLNVLAPEDAAHRLRDAGD